MKKIIILNVVLIICFTVMNQVNTHANVDDYQTFSEIMMSSGKLLSNFTDEEYRTYLAKMVKEQGPSCTVNLIVNDNVDATYISNTLYSFYNNSDTDITYSVKVEICTANKTTFKVSEAISGSFLYKVTDLKSEISYDVKCEDTSSNENSEKEVKDMDIVVEANSKCILYLTGNLSVTNGVTAFIYAGQIELFGGFEQVTIKNQYTRIEKIKI